jgi:hypothetical protein
MAASLAVFIKNSKLYLMYWFLSVVLSVIIGEAVTNLFLVSGLIEDQRMSIYMNMHENSEQFSSTGFRWDFLLYSFLPILVGAYFIFRKKFKDEIYIWIYNIYLFTNAFWVIVIRAEFSNRFAQLSWFIMPLVLIYPFCMKEFWPNQSQKTAWALLLFYAYTFYSNILN